MTTNLERLKAAGIEPSTMPKKLKAKWLKALRSGKYKRAIESLYDEKTGGFCCLGVLEHCVTGGVEYQSWEPRKFPSLDWLEENGIVFNNWTNCNVYYSGEVTTLSTLNDFYKLSFKKIADIIDRQVIGI